LVSPGCILSFQWSPTECLNLHIFTMISYKNVPGSFTIPLCVQQHENVQNTLHKI
jgi:hypothetical protein